jgi:hypothetical protein
MQGDHDEKAATSSDDFMASLNGSVSVAYLHSVFATQHIRTHRLPRTLVGRGTDEAIENFYFIGLVPRLQNGNGPSWAHGARQMSAKWKASSLGFYESIALINPWPGTCLIHQPAASSAPQFRPILSRHGSQTSSTLLSRGDLPPLRRPRF